MLSVSQICKALLAVAIASSTLCSPVNCFSTPNTVVAKAKTSTGNPSPALSFTESDLISLAEDYVATKNGFYAPADHSVHAEDFVFRAGVVGPLNKKDYLTTMGKLGICEAFDMESNAFGFCVDPDEPLAVRFFVRYTGKQVKPWAIQGTPINIPVQSQPIQGPTESFCIKFNPQGKVKFFTISNPMNYGNPQPPTTGKLGAVLGLFEHLGQPLMAKAALNDVTRNANLVVSKLLPDSMAPPITQSKVEDLPQWFVDRPY